MLSHRKGVLLDGIGSELVRSANGGRRKTLSAWLASIADEVAQTFTSGDATPSVLNGAQFITAGATAITDFDDAVEGQVIFIYRGSADIVITRNASLIETLTAASITLTATHPMASFRSVSGVWQEVERSDAAIAAAGSTAARTLAARFGDMLSPEDFGAVGNGSTDDLTPLTNWLNAVMASSSRCGYMPAKTYAISGALPNISVSGVTITGAGPSSSHDVGSGPSGTILKAITNAGFTMMTVAPTEGASAQRLDSVRILGVSFACNSLAAKGLLVKSVFRGEFDVYAQEATTSGIELDVATTLGEATSTQRNVFRIGGRQYSNSAPVLRLKGSSVGNASFNTFAQVDCAHYNASAIICENSDTNEWISARCVMAGGGSATYSAEFRGGATAALTCRSEHFHTFAGTKPVYVGGFTTYAEPAKDIRIDNLDTGNGSPDPIVEPGGTIHWGTSHADDAYGSGRYNLVVNGDMIYNQLAPATNADKSAGFDGGVVLTETSTVALTQLTNPENGQPFALRMTQSQASAQRMGYMFVIPSEDTIALRGKGVALSARIRLSTTADVRCAILEWTGTADAVAGDVVADWTSTTYTTAGFFEATTKNVTAVMETAATAATWRDLSGSQNTGGGLTANVGSSANNLIIFVWTEGTVAQNVTLDIGRVRLVQGFMPMPSIRENRATAIERIQRQVQKTYNLSTAPGASTAIGAAANNAHAALQASRWWVPFRKRMSTTSTVTVYSQTGASGNVRDVVGAADKTAATTAAGETGVTVYPTQDLTDNAIYTFHVVATAYPWT